MNYGIIVLNYLAYEATIECVNDFINQHKTKEDVVKICIVDNCSSNDSFSILERYYHNNDDIITVKTKTNIGFAKGNNYGYACLIRNFGDVFDYIIVSNDDIKLPNQGIFEWIDSKFKEYKFSILGPKVYSVNGLFYQSPLNNHPTSLAKCYFRVFKQLVKLLVFYIRDFLKIKFKEKEVFWKNSNPDDVTTQKTLHGCFLIFSKLYFSKYELPFDEKTYLYMEEDILRLRCNLCNLIMLYSPDYEVHHLQAISTNMVTGTYNKKMIFRIKNILKSLLRYIELLKE